MPIYLMLKRYRLHMIPNNPIAKALEIAKAFAPLLGLAFVPSPVWLDCPEPVGEELLVVLILVDVAIAAMGAYKLMAVLLPKTSDPPVLVPRSIVAVDVQIVA